MSKFVDALNGQRIPLFTGVVLIVSVFISTVVIYGEIQDIETKMMKKVDERVDVHVNSADPHPYLARHIDNEFEKLSKNVESNHKEIINILKGQ